MLLRREEREFIDATETGNICWMVRGIVRVLMRMSHFERKTGRGPSGFFSHVAGILQARERRLLYGVPKINLCAGA